MTKKVVVLGAGLVGNAIARDLHKDFDVLSADLDRGRLDTLSNIGVATKKLDVTDGAALKATIQDSDLVIGAVPGFMGYETLKSVIEFGKSIVDISFFPEDPFQLDDLAKEHGVVAVMDCGVAPGMGNIILGYHNARMAVDSYKCFVGGLPVKREWPWEYKAVFSPSDVIEEYTRPARYVQNNQLVIRPALSDPELLDFPGLGTLEAWNSAGLRPLAETIKIPNMIEKTLRYPGCIEYLRMLREAGFFSKNPVRIAGVEIRPLDLTAELLKVPWKLKEEEEDVTVMRIIIEGQENGKPTEIVYTLEDHFDREQSVTSMARTTGYTCTAVANLLLDGKVQEPGLYPPEMLGQDKSNFRFVLDYLEARGVRYQIQRN